MPASPSSAICSRIAAAPGSLILMVALDRSSAVVMFTPATKRFGSCERRLMSALGRKQTFTMGRGWRQNALAGIFISVSAVTRAEKEGREVHPPAPIA